VGKIHVYTGDGKGKTTAAIGLALRALGRGKRVVVIQFMKGKASGEILLLNKLKELGFPVEVYMFGSRGFVNLGNPSKRDIEEARKALNKAVEELLKKPFMLILDEVNVALKYRLISLEEVLKLIEQAKCECVELVLTGRGAPEEIIRNADLVTYMVEVKHYFKEKVKAREGIEF